MKLYMHPVSTASRPVRLLLAEMKSLPSWGKVNEVFDGFAAANKGKEFVRL